VSNESPDGAGIDATNCPICGLRVGPDTGTCPHFLCVTSSGDFISPAPGVDKFEADVEAVGGLVEELESEDWFDDALETLDEETKDVIRRVRENGSDYWLDSRELVTESWMMLDNMPASNGYWCFHRTPEPFARATKAQAQRVISILKGWAQRFHQT
jgi:hypothetical protein